MLVQEFICFSVQHDSGKEQLKNFNREGIDIANTNQLISQEKN